MNNKNTPLYFSLVTILSLLFVILNLFLGSDSVLAKSTVKTFDSGILSSSSGSTTVYGTNIQYVITTSGNNTSGGGTFTATKNSSSQVTVYYSGGTAVSSSLSSVPVPDNNANTSYFTVYNGRIHNASLDDRYTANGTKMAKLTAHSNVVLDTYVTSRNDTLEYRDCINNISICSSSNGFVASYPATVKFGDSTYSGTVSRVGTPVHIVGTYVAPIVNKVVSSHSSKTLIKTNSTSELIGGLPATSLDAYSYEVYTCNTASKEMTTTTGVTYNTLIGNYLSAQSSKVGNSTFTYVVNSSDYGLSKHSYKGTHKQSNSNWSDWTYINVGSGAFVIGELSRNIGNCTTSNYGRITNNNQVHFSKIENAPSSDNTVYRQYYAGTYEYKGTAYRGYAYAEYDFKYRYTGSFSIMENVAPTLTTTTNASTHSYVSGYNTFTVSGRVNDGDGDTISVKYRVDNGSTYTLQSGLSNGSSYSGTVNVSNLGLSQGSHTIYVWADDGCSGCSNSTSSSNTESFIVDLTAPSTTVIESPSNYTQGNVSLDPVTYASDNYTSKSSIYISPTSALATTNGLYQFTLIDSVGNSRTVNHYVTNIDRTAPQISISPNGSTTYAQSRGVTVTVQDSQNTGDSTGSGLSLVQYKWTTSPSYPSETSGWTSMTISNKRVNQTIYTPSGVTGEYYLHIKASDNVGLPTTFSSNVFMLDNILPTVEFSPNSNTAYKKSQTVKLTADDNDSGVAKVEYSYSTSNTVQPSSWSTVANGGTTTSATPTAHYYVWAKVTDKAGNVLIDKSGLYYVDNTAPIISYSPNGHTTYEKSHTTTVTTIDNNVGMGTMRYAWSTSKTVQPTSWVTGDSNSTNTLKTPSNVTGLYYLWVEAKDTLGNTSIGTSNPFYLDNTVPTITYTPNGNVNESKSHSPVVTIADPLSGVSKTEYAWSTSKVTTPTAFTEFTNNTSIVTPSNVTDTYYLWIKATDKATNSTIVVSNGYVLDNTAPLKGELTITLNSFGSLKATVNGASDSHAGLNENNAYSFRLDNGEWTAPGTNTYVFNNLQGNREYTITYKVYDNTLGNYNERNVTVDSVGKKKITISFRPNKLTTTAINPNGYTFTINEGDNVLGGTTLGSKYTVFAHNISEELEGTTSEKSVKLTDRVVSGLKPNNPYFIYAEVENSDGVQTFNMSSPVQVYGQSTIVTKVHTASKVPDLDITSLSNTSHSLKVLTYDNPSWTDYYVEYATNKSFSDKKVVTGNNWTVNTAVTNTGLSPGTTYYYRVKAKNVDNIETAWSSIYEYKTVPNAPTLNSLQVIGYEPTKNTTGIKLTFTAVTGGEKYYIYRDNVKVGEMLGNVSQGTSLTYTDYTAPYNKNYTYSVSAWNEVGSSADTTWDSKGEGIKSNTLSKYARARDLENVTVVDLTDTTVTFNLLNSVLNANIPSYKMEIYNNNTNTLVATSNWSKTINSRILTGLKLGVPYSVHVTTRNEENVENPKVILIDEFYMNRPPQIKLTKDTSDNLLNYKYSEVDGYNAIQVRGQMLDLDTIPVGDPLKITYTIKDSKGKVVNGFNEKVFDTTTAKGTWQDITDKKGSLFNIPVTADLIEGYYTITVTVTDDQFEKDSDTASFLVDKSDPKANLKTPNESHQYGIDLELYNINGNIAELTSKPYAIERADNKGNFNTLFNFGTALRYSDDLTDYTTESNTYYRYRGKVADQVGHVTNTNIIEYVSSPKLLDKDYAYLDTDPSTLVIDWLKPLKSNDGVAIEIRRNGHLIASVVNGSSYIDKNLDYEREYAYTLTAVSKDSKGNRIESSPITKTYSTGQPLLQVSVGDYDSVTDTHNVNRPIFTDLVTPLGSAFYRQGGEVRFTYKDALGEHEKVIKVNPYMTASYSLAIGVSEVKDSFPLSHIGIYELDIKADILDATIDTSKTMKVKIKEVSPLVKNINSLQNQIQSKIYTQ